MPTGSDVRFSKIREHEGSQARAWEELTYQLRPDPGPGHVETRKTRAPDGGVEWYEVYSDGHSEGYQAKFNPSLADALGGMTESVKAVTSKRPDMTRLTFAVPYDFTDSGSAVSTTDQDRWDKRVEHWRKNIPGADRVDFTVLRAGDILTELALAKHAGRRAYWFGALELTPEWFERRWQETRDLAGRRYTPEADTPTIAEGIVDGTLLTPTFYKQLSAIIEMTLDSCHADSGSWDADESMRDPLDRLQTWAHGTLPATDTNYAGGSHTSLPQEPPNYDTLRRIITALREGLSQRVERDDPRYEPLTSGFVASQMLLNFCQSHVPYANASRTGALLGPAGQGKTHTLVHTARKLLNRGVPAITVLGERFDDTHWWTSLQAILGGVDASSDDFLAALDSLAEATGSPAAIIIDALNESQNPRRWLKELPALVTAVKAHPHVALVVSFRSDYEQLVMPDGLMDLHAHLGLAGREHEALEKYCALFEVPVPSTASLNTSFTNPLFLRMYCDVLATESGMGLDAPTRSNLFDRFASHRINDVIEKLALPPTTLLVRTALNHVCDTLLANDGRPIPRADVEAACEELLPGRLYPMTLFKQMVTEGVLELSPDLTGEGELVTLAFQAYSEHLLARRLLETITTDDRGSSQGADPRLVALARRLEGDGWLWRAFAVVLPEGEGVELVDLLPADFPMSRRLQGAMFDSYADRATESFTERTRQLFGQQFSLSNPEGIDTRVRLGTRIGHRANADWLHEQLAGLALANRDATWTVAAFDVHEESAAYLRLKAWAATLVNDETSTEEIRLATLVLMWLLTSSNRYLRDDASRILAHLLSKRLDVVPDLFTAARSADDPYVQERALTCAYGAVIAGGETQPEAVTNICVALADWLDNGLPVDVLARDAALGIAAWAASRDLVDGATLESFRPPYGSSPPEEPPTAEDLEESHGLVKDGEDYREWRAYSILSSCLTWMGDFNKYVIKSDVDFFSQLPLTGQPPDGWRDPLNEVGADWAGRWVANRALGLGWTAEQFQEFESSRNLRSGRDSHKAERIGKKYQWIALHELLARLADNHHPSRQSWDDGPITYEGPWPWYGRDFDPTLPPGTARSPRTCPVALTEQEWPWLDVDLEGPEIPDSPNDWVARTENLPSREAVFFPTDGSGQEWVALSRVARWSTEQEERRNRLSSRERHMSLHQFGWLVPSGLGPRLAGLIDEHLDHSMREAKRPHGQYLGEQAWAPIARSTGMGQEDLPERLVEAGITWVRHASEQWVWEGHVLDCSLDNTLDLMLPTAELLGAATWMPHEAAWSDNGEVVCRSLERSDGSGHTTLVAERVWLAARLEQLELDLVVAAFGERQFLPDSEGRTIAWAQFTYITCLGTDEITTGPDLEVKGRVREGSTATKA